MNSEFGKNANWQWQKEEVEDIDVIDERESNLVVWNDDVNTFDWVISSLVDICEHSEIQAEQCALIVHYKGKCGVKKGNFEYLRPQAEALLDRGISATIED